MHTKFLSENLKEIYHKNEIFVKKNSSGSFGRGNEPSGGVGVKRKISRLVSPKNDCSTKLIGRFVSYLGTEHSLPFRLV